MAAFNLKTAMTALLAGSLAMTASGLALADNGGKTYDPAQFSQRIEKRVDRALAGTDATAEQKKQIATILQSAFTDMKPLRDKRLENRKAMADAMQAPTLDRVKIEAIRQEEMKVSDETSKVFTKALEDAGNVLSQAQRQAFFKQWSGDHRPHGKRHG
ncbi:MAG TPA: periplasmic heavy metal sensor [Reyranella sp.]|jgi:Spy/CpxP family protein refolding chaperone|nr:periplasmic heavy metal sensor [Reyranella sp.]